MPSLSALRTPQLGWIPCLLGFAIGVSVAVLPITMSEPTAALRAQGSTPSQALGAATGVPCYAPSKCLAPSEVERVSQELQCAGHVQVVSPKQPDDAAQHAVQPGPSPAPACPSCPPSSSSSEWRGSPPKTLQILVLTYNRAEALQRLLTSVHAADYTGWDAVHVKICLDASKGDGKPDAATLAVAKGFSWPTELGQSEVHEWPTNQGLAQQWFKCWDPDAPGAADMGLFLEDDLEVSQHHAKWLVAAGTEYASDARVASYGYQRVSLRAYGGGTLKLPAEVRTPYFGYRLLATWGFATRREDWSAFLAWRKARVIATKDPPLVPGLEPSKWYADFIQKGTTGTMWSMWYIRWAHEAGVYTLYANLPAGHSLAANWREAGEHFSGATKGPDAPLWRAWSESEVDFRRESTPFIDWTGLLSIPPEDSTTVQRLKAARTGTSTH